MSGGADIGLNRGKATELFARHIGLQSRCEEQALSTEAAFEPKPGARVRSPTRRRHRRQDRPRAKQTAWREFGVNNNAIGGTKGWVRCPWRPLAMVGRSRGQIR